ncbi:hypothetical protein [Modestobacter altitudinis]|uniref:hypothetical protein n=1 Tax=Modestobacter altitudinis TaxID=2213158 RepID=UPI00110CCBC7|nr:hypothetical protein [Modestobacter altitudinis]
MGLRLPVGGVTVLLGPSAERAAVLAALDPGSARCGEGHGALPVLRLSAAAGDDVPARLGAVEAALAQAAPVVLVDRLTAGLPAPERRRVLAALRPVAAAGSAVLVDDDDPVAVLGVADAALRTATLAVEQVPDPRRLELLAS